MINGCWTTWAGSSSGTGPPGGPPTQLPTGTCEGANGRRSATTLAGWPSRWHVLLSAAGRARLAARRGTAGDGPRSRAQAWPPEPASLHRDQLVAQPRHGAEHPGTLHLPDQQVGPARARRPPDRRAHAVRRPGVDPSPGRGPRTAATDDQVRQDRPERDPHHCVERPTDVPARRPRREDPAGAHPTAHHSLRRTVSTPSTRLWRTRRCIS
jgi:hypothetical protein